MKNVSDNEWKIPAGDANEGLFNEIAYFVSYMESHAWPFECTPKSSIATIELCYKHVEKQFLKFCTN
jgi:hypothetical protein